MAAARQALIKRIYEDPRNGFGSIADTLRQARQQDPAITRGDVVQFMETVKTREDRPQRGYNSFVPTVVECWGSKKSDPARLSTLVTQNLRLQVKAGPVQALS